MSPPNLYWLEECSNWKQSCFAARDAAEPWEQLTRLAAKQLDFVQTNQLDQIVQRLFADAPPRGLAFKPIRQAVLASSTVNHLLPGLRVAALRRGLFLQTYVTGYSQYRQELLDPSSPLYRFEPNAVLFSLDARHMVGQLENGTSHAIEKVVSPLAELWQRARAAFGCQVLQQTLLPVFPTILGNNEHRLPSSNAGQITALNHNLRCHADTAGVDLVAVDAAVQQHGLDAWYDRALWHRAKQEIHPVAAPMYGELAVRLIAAQLGRSSKCLVLDLDNTLWGGVIGDDGLDGIVLGQGSTVGEAYVDFQRWVLDQARRGIILAVCSKNDEANALAPFERHPEMLLKRSDIACFVANWNDKATNLRSIAKSLNIGLDSLVFVDDNSFERNIVRRELPMVAVPELPEDPALYARCIADAGYFEGLSVTTEDLERTQQYQANLQRESLLATATDLDSYLASLKMDLWVKPFDRVNLKRIVQLINKTNQFNLTTRRYTEQEVESLIGAEDALTLHFRLTDTLGDNGIIGVIIARPNGGPKKTLIVDTWLMSCRVLGRQVENACMNVLAAKAKSFETQEIIGEYIPTAKNNMVREHYPKLTFLPAEEHADGRSLWRLPIETYNPFKTFITVRED
jgi:FkbH-like protein